MSRESFLNIVSISKAFKLVNFQINIYVCITRLWWRHTTSLYQTFTINFDFEKNWIFSGQPLNLSIFSWSKEIVFPTNLASLVSLYRFLKSVFQLFMLSTVPLHADIINHNTHPHSMNNSRHNDLPLYCAIKCNLLHFKINVSGS